MSDRKNRSLSVRAAVFMLCAAVILMLVGGIGALALQTSYGKTDVIDFKIPTGNGRYISGSIFKPENASDKNKVPVVITEHGYLNNSKMQDINAIELSRRGIAVVAFDAYYHGKSSSTVLPVLESTGAEGTGMIDMVEYVYRSLDYVDNTKIGVMGHSMGGVATFSTLMHYGAQYQAAIEAAMAPDSEGGEKITPDEQAEADRINKVKAGFSSAIISMATEDTMPAIHASLGISYGKYDEGNYDLARGNGDVSGDCREALAAVNSVMKEGEKIDSVTVGEYYGSAKNNTLRVVYNPSHIHPWEHFSAKTSGYVTTFFQKAFQMDSGMDARDQIWFIKELFNCIAMIGLFLSIVPVAVLLLRVPVFQSLRGTVPKAVIALETKRQKILFWGRWGLCGLISAASFMPVSKLDKFIFPKTTAFQNAKWFTQPSTNFILLWAVFNGLAGLLIFWLTYKSEKGKFNLKDAGITIGPKTFFKTLLLALCIVGVFYGFVFISEYLLQTDFRFWVLGICTFTSDKLVLALLYVPLYFVFYFAMSVSNNVMGRTESGREWVNVFFCGLLNALGVILVNAIQYIKLFTSGTAFWKEDRLYPMAVLPLIVLLFIAAWIGRSLYKVTGKVWLGAMVNCMLVVMIGIANTATLAVY